MRDRHDIAGESYVADPRERRHRVIAQLIDKPLSVVLVALAFAVAARVPPMVVEGWRPSAWGVLGLWICLSVMARMTVRALLARYRAAMGITAPGAARGTE
jgi:hypothetical protein